MGFERHLSRSDDEFGVDTVPPKKAYGGGGTLQAEHLFPTPDTGVINGGADTINGLGVRVAGAQRILPHRRVQAIEGVCGEIAIKATEMEICL
jgi:hypothetical protein